MRAFLSTASHARIHAIAECDARSAPQASGAPVRTEAQKPEISFRYDDNRSVVVGAAAVAVC